MPLYVTTDWVNESAKHYFETIPKLKNRAVLERIELIIKLTAKSALRGSHFRDL